MSTDATATNTVATTRQLIWSATFSLRALKRALPLLKPEHNKIPITNSVLIEADPKGAHNLVLESLTGSPFFTYGISRVRIQSYMEHGDVASKPMVMPYEAFQALTKHKIDNDTSMELRAYSDNTIEAIYGRSTNTIKLMDYDDYPIIPNKTLSAPVDTVGLNAHYIAMLRQYTSKDNFRPAMNGILCNDKDYVATDGYTLLRLPRKSPADRGRSWALVEPVLMQIPHKQKLIGEGTYFFTQRENNWNGMFCTDRNMTHELLLPSSEDKFPAYENVIPDKTDHTVCITQATALELQQKMQYIAKIASSIKDDIVTPMVMTFTAEAIALEFTHENIRVHESFPLEQEATSLIGTPMRIGFNPEYMTKVLNPLTHSDNENHRVYIGVSSPLRAAIFYDCRLEKCALIMPMRLA